MKTMTIRLEPLKETDRTGFSSNDEGAVTAPSARPGGLDNVDGGLERRVYSQTPQIAQAFGRNAALLPDGCDLA